MSEDALKPLTIRLSRREREILDALCAAEDRPAAAMIRHLIRQAEQTYRIGQRRPGPARTGTG